MSVKLSKTQQESVAYIRAHGGLIERRMGGFWTTPDTPIGSERNLDTWSIGINTVRALERKGILKWMNQRQRIMVDGV